jgi:hypothetical protein
MGRATIGEIILTIKRAFYGSRRFSERPFTITFDAKRVNPNYDAAAAVGPNAGNAQHQHLHIRPKELAPAVFVNPLLGGQFPFSAVHIVMDGVPIEGPSFSQHGHHYQVLNQIFCSAEQRQERYGEDLVWVSNASEMRSTPAVAAIEAQAALPIIPDAVAPFNAVIAARNYQPAVPLYLHPVLDQAMDSLTFDAAGFSQANVLQFGFDGHFPFSAQNNALREINGNKIVNGYLPPGTSFTFTLVKRDPMTAVIERPNVTDLEYFETPAGVPAATVAQIDDIIITIKSLTLTYESCTLDSQEIMTKMKKGCTYKVDFPLLRSAQISGGVMLETTRLNLPANTRLVYLVFMMENHLNYHASARSHLCHRYRFIPGLTRLEISLGGKDGILFKKGFSNLGNANGRLDPALREYHAELRKKNLYEKSFDEFFPSESRNGGNIHGYDQVLLLDLSGHKISEGLELAGTMTFANLSPNRWQMMGFCVVQGTWEWSPLTRWTKKIPA